MSIGIKDCHCPCQETGWTRTCQDEWVECNIHYTGQLHPESRILLLDSPDLLNQEDRKSVLKWKMKIAQNKIIDLNKSLQETKTELFNLELEFINKTPTRKMPAVLDWSDIVFDGSQQPAIEINKK